MKISHKKLEYQTKELFDIRDITDEVADFIKTSEIKNGLINVQSLHTTATVFLNENEPLLLEDIKKNLAKTAPQDIEYKHDDFTIRTVNMCADECANGHSHCKALHLPSTLTLNVLDGKMQFGTWQRILHIELDRARTRKVHLMIIGE